MRTIETRKQEGDCRQAGRGSCRVDGEGGWRAQDGRASRFNTAMTCLAPQNQMIERSAEISECGKYRWWLRRIINGDNERCVCFVMLNPSKADAKIDDPTIRRCMSYASEWGYSVLEVRNLFSWRATDKHELLKADNPCGDPRGLAELGNAHKAELIIAAWGTWVPFRRDWTMKDLYSRGRPIYCLRTTIKGAPVHPLYQKKTLTPQPFWNCGPNELGFYAGSSR